MKNVQRFLMSIVFVSVCVIGWNIPVHANTDNYFLINKNYFEDSSIEKGDLDKPTGPIGKPRDPLDRALTNHEFYMKYNFGPEMSNSQSNKYSYNPYNYLNGLGAYVLKQYDAKGNAIMVNNEHALYSPTAEDRVIQANNFDSSVATSNAPEVVNSFGPSRGTISIKPLFFSYLYVGDGIEGQQNNYQYTPDMIIPDSMGYNESNKLSDYMLNTANNFIIPSRYNAMRDDVTLLLRSKTDINVNTPQVFLEVVDEEGNILKGSQESPKEYFNTKISLHLLPFSYNHLGGTYQQNRYKNETAKYNGTVHGIDQFNTVLNTGLNKIRSYSSQGIVMGVGGGVNINGFYRNGLEDVLATNDERYEDHVKTYHAKYYVWQKELEVSGEPRRTWGTAALAHQIDGINNVLTPEVAKYNIEVTRPTITSTTPLELEYDLMQDDFDDVLGLESIKVEDEGVSKTANAQGNVEEIAVELDNIRVRIKETSETEWSTPMEMKNVKAALSNYAGQTVDVLYTYSATDAQQGNINLLPEEIEDNTGAYAIPLQRTVTISEEVASEGEIVVQYVVNDPETVILEKSFTGEMNTAFAHEAPIYYEYEGETYVLTSDETVIEADYEDEKQVFVFYYKKIDEQKGLVNVTYVDTEGNMLSQQEPIEGAIGEDYRTSAPQKLEVNGSQYQLVENPLNASGVFEKGTIEVEYVYEKVAAVEPPEEVESPQTDVSDSGGSNSADSPKDIAKDAVKDVPTVTGDISGENPQKMSSNASQIKQVSQQDRDVSDAYQSRLPQTNGSMTHTLVGWLGLLLMGLSGYFIYRRNLLK